MKRNMKTVRAWALVSRAKVYKVAGGGLEIYGTKKDANGAKYWHQRLARVEIREVTNTRKGKR